MRSGEGDLGATPEIDESVVPPVADLDPIVGPSLAAGTGNPDGMHWGWDAHEGIGLALAAELQRRGGC